MTYVTANPRGSDPPGLSYEDELEFDTPRQPPLYLTETEKPPSWDELIRIVWEGTAEVANGP